MQKYDTVLAKSLAQVRTLTAHERTFLTNKKQYKSYLNVTIRYEGSLLLANFSVNFLSPDNVSQKL